MVAPADAMTPGELVFDAAHVAAHKDPEHPLLIKAGNSLRKRIDLMCRSCIYDELAPGNWRQQTMACQCDYCPLWAVRPEYWCALISLAYSGLPR